MKKIIYLVTLFLFSVYSFGASNEKFDLKYNFKSNETFNQNVKVKVIKVDLKHKKIGLSIVKAVKEAEKAEYSSFINDKPELTLDLKEQLEGLNN